MSCVAEAIGELSNDFRLTSAGLPDFAALGDASLSPTEFQTLIACLPGLSLIPDPVLMAEAAWSPAFPSETRAQAQSVGDAARKSVVYLELGTGILATGFFVSEDGLILTNRHNVTDLPPPGTVTAWLLDGRGFEARILGIAREVGPDVALLKVDVPGEVQPLTIGSSVGLSRDQPLVVVGHAGGMGNWAVTLGAFEKSQTSLRNLPRDLVTTVPTMPGNSGSPVLDLQGRVVGMIHGGTERDKRTFGVDPPRPAEGTVHEVLNLSLTNFALAVPIEDAMALVAGWTP